MKTHYKTITTVLLISTFLGAKAQTSGVYMSAADFESGKLAYAIDCKTEKHKIKLNEFLGKDYITIVHDKRPHNLKKSEIFGYRDCNDKVYKLAIDKHYEVMNAQERILLYVIELPGSKNQKARMNYYFSISAAGEVKGLTLTNLKNAFPDNHKFHDALDTEFKADADLVQFDSYHKVYKVNRIYSNSLGN
jgi:hypothetical protein